VDNEVRNEQLSQDIDLRNYVIVPANEIDDYLASLPEPKRSTLEAVRVSILEILPDAQQCFSYGMPAFKVNGKVLAGFAAFKNHLAYLPHSSMVFNQIEELAAYKFTPGSLHFAIDEPLPKHIVAKLIEVRKKNLWG